MILITDYAQEFILTKQNYINVMLGIIETPLFDV